MHSSKCSIKNYFMFFFMLISLCGIIWASLNSTHAHRPGLRPNLLKDPFPDNTGSFFNSMSKTICSTHVATEFYFIPSFVSFKDASRMYGGSPIKYFCGACLYTQYDLLQISINTILLAQSHAILLKKYHTRQLWWFTCQASLLEPRLWENPIGMNSKVLWGHLDDYTCWIEGWRVAPIGDMGTGIHVGSFWDWGSLLRWHCKSWSVLDTGRKLRKFQERCFLL